MEIQSKFKNRGCRQGFEPDFFLVSLFQTETLFQHFWFHPLIYILDRLEPKDFLHEKVNIVPLGLQNGRCNMNTFKWAVISHNEHYNSAGPVHYQGLELRQIHHQSRGLIS